MSPMRQIKLGLFVRPAGNHIASWRHPDSHADAGANFQRFVEMARQANGEARDPERMKIATLTARERQTIMAVAGDAAAPGKVIAGRLCISEHTLRNHLSSIYGKLGVANRLDLYAYATKHRLHKGG